MLYKYPQREFPYNRLVNENRRRGKLDPEFELVDTGIFDDDRYFDVFVEYAKADPHDVLMQITVINRGPDAATVACAAAIVVSQHLVVAAGVQQAATCRDRSQHDRRGALSTGALSLVHRRRSLEKCELLRPTKRHQPCRRLVRTWPMRRVISKMRFTNTLIHGNHAAVNPAHTGTKAAAHFVLDDSAGGKSATIRTRLC